MSRGCPGKIDEERYDRSKNSEKCYNDTHDDTF